MRYVYRAVDDAGHILNGSLVANHDSDLEARLARMGLQLISYRSRREFDFKLPWQRRVSRRELTALTLHLEQLTRAGVPLLDALGDLRDSAERKTLREIAAQLIEDIEGGKLLSEALSAHGDVFDPVYVSLIRAGEHSGQLTEVLAQLAEALKWQDEIAAQTKKALAYPAFVAVAVLGATAFMMIYLVPQMVSFLTGLGQTLPLATRVLIATSDAVQNWGLIALVVCVAAIAGLRFWAKRSAALRLRLHRYLLSVPLIGGILHKLLLARFAQCFGMLFAAGIPVLEGLSISAGVVHNVYVQEAIERVRDQIREGRVMSAAFERERVFPPLVLRMIRSGENTGALDGALENVTYFYQRDVREAVERLQTLIEPTMTVVLGGLLFWVMGSLLSPIFDSLGKLR
ncbi:type II secretion system F family protein [Chitinibacteraceae bacterium HSL-7]